MNKYCDKKKSSISFQNVIYFFCRRIKVFFKKYFFVIQWTLYVNIAIENVSGSDYYWEIEADSVNVIFFGNCNSCSFSSSYYNYDLLRKTYVFSYDSFPCMIEKYRQYDYEHISCSDYNFCRTIYSDTRVCLKKRNTSYITNPTNIIYLSDSFNFHNVNVNTNFSTEIISGCNEAFWVEVLKDGHLINTVIYRSNVNSISVSEIIPSNQISIGSKYTIRYYYHIGGSNCGDRAISEAKAQVYELSSHCNVEYTVTQPTCSNYGLFKITSVRNDINNDLNVKSITLYKDEIPINVLKINQPVRLMPGNYSFNVVPEDASSYNGSFTIQQADPFIISGKNTINSCPYPQHTGAATINFSGYTNRPYTAQLKYQKHYGKPYSSRIIDSIFVYSSIKQIEYSLVLSESWSQPQIKITYPDKRVETKNYNSYYTFSNPQTGWWYFELIDPFSEVEDRWIKLLYAPDYINDYYSRYATFSNLYPGNYSVTISGSLCSAIDTFTINSYPQTFISETSIHTPLCNNMLGAITVNVNPTISPYNFYLNGQLSSSQSNTFYTYTNLDTGRHILYCIDNHGCESNRDTVYFTYNPPKIDNLTITNPTCAGDNTGSMMVEASSADSILLMNDKNLIISKNAVTDKTFDSLFAGNYRVIAKYGGCISDFITAILTNPPVPHFEANIQTTPITCAGNEDGKIKISNPNNLKIFYLYKKDSLIGYVSNSFPTFNNLPADTFLICAQTQLGCLTDTSLVIVENRLPVTARIDSIPLKCPYDTNSGSIRITQMSGGNGGYAYSISTSQDEFSEWQMCTDSTYIDKLSDSRYYIMIRDSLDCQSNLYTATIERPRPLYFQPNSSIYTGFPVPCYDDTASASIIFSPTGGNGNYSVMLNGVSKTNNYRFDSLRLFQSYTCTLLDSKGCHIDTMIQLTQRPASLNIQIDTSNYHGYAIRCYGSSDGWIKVMIQGGVSPYTLSLWQDSLINKVSINNTNFYIFNNLRAGTYRIDISDINGCTTERAVVLHQPSVLHGKITYYDKFSNRYDSIYPYHGYAIDCKNNSTKVKVLANGGISSYLFDWNDLSDSINYNLDSVFNNYAGNYVVKIKDQNGCVDTIPYTINEPDSVFQIISITTDKVSCYYKTDGNVTLKVTGGVSNLDSCKYINININSQSYDTLISTDSVSFTNLAGNVFRIIAYDANGCMATVDSIDIRNFDTLRVSVNDYVKPSCFGANDGSITLLAQIKNNNNYQNGYQYSVYQTFKSKDTLVFRDYSNDSLIVTNLSAGWYKIIAVDAIGCIDTTFFNLSQPDKLRIHIDSIISNTCFNDNTAKLILHASGGLGGYKFSYNYSNVYKDFSKSTADTSWRLVLDNLNWNEPNTDIPIKYYISLRDKNFKANQTVCTVVDSFALPVVKRITYQLSYENPKCHNDSNGWIILSGINGGKGDKHIHWYRIENPTEAIATGEKVTDLASGNILFRIVDAVGCTVMDELSLKNPNPLKAKRYISLEPCEGYGNVTYLLENVQGNNLYYQFDTSILYETTERTIVAWIDTGKHAFNFYDDNHCSVTDTFSYYYSAPHIDSVKILSASIGGIANGMAIVYSSCGNGNNQYQWTLPDNTQLLTKVPRLERIPKGNYQVVVIDKKGKHSLPKSFVIEEVEHIVLLIDSIHSTTCTVAQNGFARVSYNAPSKVIQVVWKDAMNNIVGMGNELKSIPAGKYSIEIVDSLGNKGFTSFKILSRPDLSIVNVLKKRVSCHDGNDGTIGIQVSGGSGQYMYFWSNGMNMPQINKLPAGLYRLRVQDKEDSSCVTTTEVTLDEPTALQINLCNTVKPTCRGGNDGRITVLATGGNGGYKYYWPDVKQYTATAIALTPDTYRVQVTDIKGCISDSVFVLPDTLPIAFDTVITTPPLCYGNVDGTITVSLKNGRPNYMIYWPDFKDGIIGGYRDKLKGGTYRIYAEDANGCKFYDSITLEQPVPLQIDTIQIFSPTCSDGSNGNLQISVSGGTLPYTYLVDNKRTQNEYITGISAGRHQVRISDKNGCIVSRNITMMAPSPLTFSYLITPPSCYGLTNGSILIQPQGGTPPYRVYMYNQLQKNPIINLGANDYTIQVKDTNNCFYDKSIKLQQPQLLTAKIINLSNNPCYGDCKAALKIIASGGTFPYTYQWSTGRFDSLHINLCAGNYTVTATDANQCKYRLTTKVLQPLPICRDSIVTIEPNCFGGSDGQIIAYFSGGTGKLKYTWDKRKSGVIFTNVPAGWHTVHVIDDNQCLYHDSVYLDNPPKEKITRILPYYKLCINQVAPLTPGYWQRYWWFKDSKYLNDHDTLWVYDPGIYAIKVMSNKGCFDSMTFSVEYSHQVINSNFLLSHEAIAGEEVQIIDVSWPLPDNISWKYPTDSVTLIENSDDRQRVIFQYPGEYLVQLKTFTAGCIDSVAKIIVVYVNDTEREKGKYPVSKTSNIVDLQLYPNPATESVNVYVKLVDVQNIVLEIYTVSTGERIVRQELKGLDNYLQQIDLSSQRAGVYGLRLITNGEVKNILFIKL